MVRPGSTPQQQKVPVRNRPLVAGGGKRVSSARRLPRHAPVGVQLARPTGREDLRRKRRIRLYARLGGVVGVLAVIVGGVSYLSHLDNFEIQSVKVKGVHMLSASAITSVVEENLKGNRGGILSKRNVLVYPQEEIAAHVAETFPVLKKVKVEAVGVTQTDLTVTVEERTPYALWCTDGTSSSCFVMDEEGFVFATALQANAFGQGLIVFQGGFEAMGDPIGKKLLPGNFESVAVAIQTVREIIPNPVGVTISGEDIMLRYPSGLEVRFTTTRAAELEVLMANLRAALESEALSGVPHERIEYIDLRFENRLYYKLRS